MIELLITPIDPMRPHEVGLALSLHGRMMVLAWGVLLPLGVVVARFCKVLPGQDWPREVQNPFWFTWHRILQWTGLAVMLVGLALILLVEHDGAGAALHHWLGWSVIALAAIQLVAVLTKGSGGGPGPDGVARGDHFTMARRRVIFEWTHKLMGYAAMLVSIASILSGMWVANGYVWMWIVIIGWWTLLVATCTILQRRGWTVDTYQAIWGTDPTHPGNQRPPIGWGIRRGPPVPFGQTVSIKKRQQAAKGKLHVPH